MSSHQDRGEVAARVLVLALVTVTLVALGVLVRQWSDERPPAAPVTAGLIDPTPPEPLTGGGTYVLTEVLPGGDVVVTQWIESRQQLFSVMLVPPRVADMPEMTAEEVRVLADGRVVYGPERIDPGTASRYYSLQGATSVQIRYRLTGALERSSSAPGRALARLTALDVVYEPASQHVTRTVTAAEVLSMACAPPTDPIPGQPCGARVTDGEWTVELAGTRTQDRVMAALTLG